MESTYHTAIELCIQCANACDHCAASCLREEDVNMLSACIQSDLECSAMCKTAAQLMHLQSTHANAACQLCADICIACAEECEKHAPHMEHCKLCAEVCRRCAEECRKMSE